MIYFIHAIFLLAFYFVIIFFGGGGHAWGPFVILFGLASVPLFLDIPSAFFLPIAYFVGCVYIWNLFYKGRITRKYLLVLAATHLLGIAISILIDINGYDSMRFSNLRNRDSMIILGYTISIVLLLSYWAFYILTLPRNKTGA